jgi:hypothetical protein
MSNNDYPGLEHKKRNSLPELIPFDEKYGLADEVGPISSMKYGNALELLRIDVGGGRKNAKH